MTPNRILHLTWTTHALQRFTERVGDIKPPQALNLADGTATVHKTQDARQSKIYAITDRGRYYRLVITDKGVVLTVKPDYRTQFAGRSARSDNFKPRYNRRHWKNEIETDEL